VWLAVRLIDLEPGDRVVIVEGKLKDVQTPEEAWAPVVTTLGGVTAVDRKVTPPRDGTARIYKVGDRMMAFVSPIEADSVERVLHNGADSKRGDPPADGIIGLDLRARRLPTIVERKFPSISSIIAALERIRATATLEDDGMHLNAQIVSSTSEGADKAQRFLLALRDNVKDPRYTELLAAVKIERVEGTVHIRWTVPAKVLLALVGTP
jgi:hypothetical protein